MSSNKTARLGGMGPSGQGRARTTQVVMGGQLVTSTLRSTWEQSRDLHEMAKLVPEMRVVDLALVVTGRARLEGDSSRGFEVVIERPEAV